jgi:hypothetical protein
VSKQDSQFFNTFSIVIGGLVALALVLFAIARFVGVPFEDARALADSQMQAAVAERISPVGKVAIAGKDNSALAIVAANTDAGAAPAAALPANGEETYKQVCATRRASPARRSPATRPRGRRASRRARTRCTSTRSKASRARAA